MCLKAKPPKAETSLICSATGIGPSRSAKTEVPHADSYPNDYSLLSPSENPTRAYRPVVISPIFNSIDLPHTGVIDGKVTTHSNTLSIGQVCRIGATKRPSGTAFFYPHLSKLSNT